MWPDLDKNFPTLWQSIDGLFCIWQNFEPTLGFFAISQIFIVVNAQILKKYFSHLVTLVGDTPSPILWLKIPCWGHRRLGRYGRFRCALALNESKKKKGEKIFFLRLCHFKGTFRLDRLVCCNVLSWWLCTIHCGVRSSLHLVWMSLKQMNKCY